MGIIRVALALSVVIWHVPGNHTRALNAAVAVLAFFMVSGFYMALVINEKYAPSGAGWVKRFYQARALRLYPVYLAMCVVMVAVYAWSHHPNPFTSRLPVSFAEQLLLALTNITIVGQDLYEMMNHVSGGPVRALLGDAFFNPGYMLVGQAWSLSSEIFFYLLAPIVVRSPIRLLALVASSLAIRFALVVNGFTTGVWCYWFVPATLCMFGMGSLGYWAYRRIKTWRWAASIGWAAIAGMVGWVLVMTWLYDIVIPVNGTNSLDEPRFWIAYLSFALALPFAFCATKRVALDRMVGDLSYPLYIVHGLIIGLLFNQLGHPESNGFVLLAAAVSIAAAVAMRIVVEIPAERRFKDLPTHRPSLAEPSAVPIAATSQ